MDAATPPEDRTAELAETFHILGEVNRLRIMLTCLEQAVCVQDIAGRLGLSQSLASHHLRLLRAARLVRAERRGKKVFYRAADEHVQRVLCDMTAHVDEPAGE